MADPVEALILDLVEWIAAAPRSQADVMEVWRTSCPRLPVWEEAVERGLVARGRVVTATDNLVIASPCEAIHLATIPKQCAEFICSCDIETK